MSHIVIHSCDWCGEEHRSFSREIVCKSGNDVDLHLDDLCPKCYTKLVRALRNRRDLVADKVITSGQWIGSVFAAAALGAFIAAIISAIW